MRRARAMPTRCLKTNSTSLIDWCARCGANSIASTSSPFHSSHPHHHLLGAAPAATNCCVNSIHCVDVLLGARRGVAYRRCRRRGGDKGNVSVTCCSPMRRAARVNTPASRATRRDLPSGAHIAVRIRLQRPRRTLASSLSTRRSRSGAGGGLLLYSFDTLCR
jgi:hypothetical protein